MDDYSYSSDDEVVCGPPTRREIEKHLLKPSRNIETRKSCMSSLLFLTARSENESVSKSGESSYATATAESFLPTSQVQGPEEENSNSIDISDDVIVIDSEEENSPSPEMVLKIEEPDDDHQSGVLLDFENTNVFNHLCKKDGVLLDNVTATLCKTTIENKENEVVEEDSSLHLNDTLEEMNMLLKYGLDYDISNDACQKHENSVQEKKKPLTTPNKFDYLKSPIAEYIKSSSSDNHFKIPVVKPMRPIKSPALIKSPASKYLDVVSPIAVYIKNSPRPCVRQNINAKFEGVVKTGGATKKMEDGMKMAELPKVTYKPRKQIVTDVTESVTLPKSIKKLVPENEIVNHYRGRDFGHGEVSLNEENLTIMAQEGDNDFSFLSMKKC